MFRPRFASRPPPPSSLFPYTTLFRSLYFPTIPFAPAAAVSVRTPVKDCLPTVITTGIVTVQDRKSTRLNSSHLVTSYAVFCLKKKSITQHEHNTASHDG